MKNNETGIIETLTDSFLISTSKMPDARFEEQVIYICSHTDEGAMGVAVNRPNPVFTMAEVLKSTNLPVPPGELGAVYVGGPVELESAFILFSSEYRTKHQMDISDTVSLTRESKVLEDIAYGRGPEKYLFILGYAGWGPGQLEAELTTEGWLTVPSNDHIMFDASNDEKWRMAAMQYGIDIQSYADVVGNA